MFYSVLSSYGDYDGYAAGRVFFLFLPFVYLYWWMRLTPRGCTVSIIKN